MSATTSKPKCPKCGSYNTRRATAYWQCLGCGLDWQEAYREVYVRQAAVIQAAAAEDSQAEVR